MWALAVLFSPALALAGQPVVPDVMRAAAFDRGGGPEVLQVHQLPVPQPRQGEVLVSLHAAGVGAWEAAARRSPGKDVRFPVVLGLEGSGVVAAVGPGVKRWKVGDAVYGEIAASYAQYATASENRIARIPPGSGFVEAAAVGISGLSAIQGVEDILRLKRGETLIIHGASGAVGSLAIQVAKRRGVRVLATVGDEPGRALATRLGADLVINGRTEDIGAAANSLAPHGVDAVLGLVGGDALEHCIDSLRKDGEGRVAYLYGVQPPPRPRYGVNMTVYSYVANARTLAALESAIRKSGLKAVIGAEYPLDQAAAAHRDLERNAFPGKIVLRID